jgi:hypothetical protein
MHKTLFSSMILFLLAACGSPSVSGEPTLLAPPPVPAEDNSVVEAATPVCIAFEPTPEDIDRALSFTGNFFETEDWARTYTVAEDKVTVTWYSETLISVVYLEALIFPCGYEDLDLDQFFNVDSWQIIFENYQGYEYITECRNDSGLRLYEFIAIDQGAEYEIRYWTVNDTDTRVITLMIVLPVESPDLMDEFAYSLFPTLEICQ